MGALELAERVEQQVRRFKERALMKRYGGIQWCPWCRQCAQSGDGEWSFRDWEAEPTLDVLTCSVCSGTSIWLFGLGMIYMGPLDPPAPAFEARIDVAAIRASQAPNPTPHDGGQ